ncbi:MAG TPA: sigma-70 family RNA polymerase sigma factor [Streptosporangiaceae bacterium]
MTGDDDATAIDDDFARLAEPYRRELLAHCYRMLGSVDDAEDLVQETYLRAWRSYERFEGRSSLRSWLYRIATNACLTALEQRGRRPLPSGLGEPSGDPEAPPAGARTDVPWLQPIPDALVTPDSGDPAAVVAMRDTLRLALIASLQYLPARQRAVLLLRDVLGWPAAEVAELLAMSTVAVKSALQRARARLDEVAPAAEDVTEPAEPELRALLDRYIAAFENSDAAALEKLLRQEASLEMAPSPTWFAGRVTCARYLAAQAIGSKGDWLMIPTMANGQPAAAAYLRGADGTYNAFAIAVLTAAAARDGIAPGGIAPDGGRAGNGAGAGISRITLFGEPGLFPAFGLPAARPPRPAR